MQDMPRPRPPHLHRQITQHGRAVWYVRIGKGPRTRIKAAFGTPEFDAEYQAAITNQPPRPPSQTKEGTLAWLLDRYRETTAWTGLSLATRRQRENIFRHVLETAGKQPISKIATSSIMAGRDRRAATPSQARHFLDACAAFSAGRRRRRLSDLIRRLESMIRHGQKAKASFLGQRKMLLPMRNGGQSVRGSVYG